MPINPLHYGWDVQAPPRPRYANGLVVGEWPGATIHDPGPHPDPGFPIVPGGPFGNPTNSIHIRFNGLVIGWDPPVIVDPGPHGPGPIVLEPRPGPGESQIAFMLRCEAVMIAPPHSMAPGAATAYCAAQWGMGPRMLPAAESASAETASDDVPKPPPPPPEPTTRRGRK